MATLSSGKSSNSVNSGKLTIENGNNRMLVNDGSNDRLLIGEEDSGDIVMKLSQTGYDVKEASSTQLIMSSEFNSFKIVQSGLINGAKAANNLSGIGAAVAHNLGYAPLCVGYAVSASWLGGGAAGLNQTLPYIETQGGAYFGGIRSQISLYTTNSNVYVKIGDCYDYAGAGLYSSALTCVVKYFLLVETLA